MTKLDKPLSFERPGRRTCLACVSLALSKIPYGGFSPVRLQTELSSRRLRRGAHTPPLIGGQQHRRSTPITLAGNPPFQAVGGVSFDVLRSRGPWLANGLFCPAGSSLTMASSEALDSSRRFMSYPAGLCPCGGFAFACGRGSRDSPIYSTCPCEGFASASVRAVFRTPSDRAGPGCSRSARAAFAVFAEARHPNHPRKSFHTRSLLEAAKFT